MRTTLTLDDDLAAILKQRARTTGASFREVLNQTLRSALAADAVAPPGETPRTIPHSFGFRDEIDLDKLNQLAHDLEVEAFVEKGRLQPMCLASASEAR